MASYHASWSTRRSRVALENAAKQVVVHGRAEKFQRAEEPLSDGREPLNSNQESVARREHHAKAPVRVVSDGYQQGSEGLLGLSVHALTHEAPKITASPSA